MSQSPSDRPPAALTVTTSLAGLTSSWLNLALNADRLDEELSSKSAESLFIRLCEQISRIPDPELPKEDLPDIQIHKRKERFSHTGVHAGVQAGVQTRVQALECTLARVYLKNPKKALLLALRIWSRQKWSFEWISEKIPLRRQEQFFTEYRNIYDSTCSTDLNNIVTLTDHHIGNF